ncbi:hypothetical protein IFM89_007825 [Coptis chinensis]|uniref:UBL3-like ubiquitin domain-containing protein n=1 Tax=Coptis chinensis TaxID=261450 RepID=A0A835I331_9MAGN|nr:hypothetical protein IFM89_007825 [Coptis chinensis]
MKEDMTPLLEPWHLVPNNRRRICSHFAFVHREPGHGHRTQHSTSIWFGFLDKENGPKTINDVKLINAGKILENHRNLAESRVPVAELPGGVITMHVVVQPPMFDKNNGTKMRRMTRNIKI